MSIGDVMRLLQFGDSLLPIGGFTFSNGLETAVHEGQVQDVTGLREFVRTACSRAAASDGIALLEAHRGAREAALPRILRADQALFNRKLNSETRAMTVRMGKKLAEVASHVVRQPILATWLATIHQGATPGTYPVTLGLTLATLGLPEGFAFAVHQYGAAAMILSASLRLMRISYLDAQSILYEINGAAEAEYERYRDCKLDDMASFAPMMDILAARHVGAHVRLFMS